MAGPSILDEDRPFNRDPALDIYAPDCPNRAPYDDAFVAVFRHAQLARNRRITARVRETLEALKARDPDMERPFVVYGTMCDVRWTDPTQDPSDRRPHTCYLGDPRIANDGPVGLARFTTLRSWLSQWSYDESRANGVAERGQRLVSGPGDQQHRRPRLHSQPRPPPVRRPGQRRQALCRDQGRRPLLHRAAGPAAPGRGGGDGVAGGGGGSGEGGLQGLSSRKRGALSGTQVNRTAFAQSPGSRTASTRLPG